MKIPKLIFKKKPKQTIVMTKKDKEIIPKKPTIILTKKDKSSTPKKTLILVRKK